MSTPDFAGKVWKSIDSIRFLEKIFLNFPHATHFAKTLLVQHDEIMTKISVFQQKIPVCSPQVFPVNPWFLLLNLQRFPRKIRRFLRRHCSMRPAEDLGAQCRPSTTRLALGIHLAMVSSVHLGGSYMVNDG